MDDVHRLRFEVTSSGPSARIVEFTPRAVFNAAFAGRDASDVERHIADVSPGGQRPPFPIPALAPVSPHNLVTYSEIGEYSSGMVGEVEYVLLFEGDEIFVGVGSDHCDCDLESHDFAHSKNVAPNVMSRQLWSWPDVQEHFDDLLLRCRVLVNGVWHVAQEARCATLKSPSFWLEHQAFAGGIPSGTVLFSGTINHADGVIKGEAYEVALIDPRLDRAISHSYRCIPASVPRSLDVRAL